MRNKILINLCKVLPVIAFISGLSFSMNARADLDASSICSLFPGYYSSEFSATALVAGYAPSQWCNYLFPQINNLAQLQKINQFNHLPYTNAPSAPSSLAQIFSSSTNNNPLYFNNSYYATVTAAQQNTQNNITNALNMTATYFPLMLSNTLTYTAAPDLPIAQSPPPMPYMVPQSGYVFPASTSTSNSFDINTLLGPLQYPVSPSKQGTYPPYQPAQNFIVLSGELANPPKALNFSYSDRAYTASEVATEIKNNPDTVGRYLAELHAYTAQVGAAVGNLNMFYAERMPVTNLANQATIPQKYPGINPNSPNDASPLLVKQFFATYRVNNANWYNQIQSSSPAELERQTLILLAEMRAEMFYQTEEIKRLNATLSILILQNANNGRTIMEASQDYDKASKQLEADKESD